MSTLLDETLANLRPVDRGIEGEVRAHLDDLTKPRGSLGRLEEIALRYCLITGQVKPELGEKAIFIFAGDHGVAAEGVSAYPSEVTPQMVMNMLAGGAAVNVLGEHAGAEVRVVDVGVDDPLESAGVGLIRRKVRPGTGDIARGPAMSVDEARRAVEVGIELAAGSAAGGTTLLGSGEMGIANTTPSSALFAALLPCDVAAITGRGTGIDDRRLAHKIEVIERALEVNSGQLGTPLEALAALGGLEIAAICGLVLGGAAARVPIVIDGFISSAGALVACRMKPEAADYLFFSHMSAEAGHGTFFEKFGAKPLLDLGMRLGEGTGAALAMTLIDAALKLYNGMATFSSAGVTGRDEK
jgi:nicotinate-nucleotide--dimethylbenzimidazole phosphoribosyltransferase